MLVPHYSHLELDSLIHYHYDVYCLKSLTLVQENVWGQIEMPLSNEKFIIIPRVVSIHIFSRQSVPLSGCHEKLINVLVHMVMNSQRFSICTVA